MMTGKRYLSIETDEQRRIQGPGMHSISGIT
jgi:hypothetical protein